MSQKVLEVIRNESINAGLCYMLDMEYQAGGNGVNASEACAVFKGLFKELDMAPLTCEEVRAYISNNAYIQSVLVEFDMTPDRILEDGINNKMWGPE